MDSPLDRALEALDAGLQLPMEAASAAGIEGRCARCPADAAEGSDFCSGCRAFLLSDSDSDPMAGESAAADLAAVERLAAEAQAKVAAGERLRLRLDGEPSAFVRQVLARA